MTQIEALARRAAAAGVPIQTLSSFVVARARSPESCSDTAPSRPRTFRKASVDWGSASANWSPA